MFLSVNADMFYRNLPFKQRVRAIADAGFGVEFWGWRDRDVDTLAAMFDVTFTNMSAQRRGSLDHPEGVQDYIGDVLDTLPVARRLNCRQLMLLAGELSYEGKVVHAIAAHPATLWITAYKTPCQLAEIAAKYDVIFSLEVLNTKVDHAGYPFPHCEDVVRLIEQVGSPQIRVLLDVYHVQIEQGNVIQLIRNYADFIGYVHVADVPDRHEPGTGELNYPAIIEAMRQAGYDGTIGLGAFPLADETTAFDRFKQVFTA